MQFLEGALQSVIITAVVHISTEVIQGSIPGVTLGTLVNQIYCKAIDMKKDHSGYYPNFVIWVYF